MLSSLVIDRLQAFLNRKVHRVYQSRPRPWAFDYLFAGK